MKERSIEDMTPHPITEAVSSPGTFYGTHIRGVDTFDGSVYVFDPEGFRPLKGNSGFIRGTTYTPTGNGHGTLTVWTKRGKPAGLRYGKVPGWKVGGLHAGFGKRKTVPREPTSAELCDLMRASIEQAKAARVRA